jgi:hypothetical protein
VLRGAKAELEFVAELDTGADLKIDLNPLVRLLADPCLQLIARIACEGRPLNQNRYRADGVERDLHAR